MNPGIPQPDVTFEHEGVTYSVGKLAPIIQLHVSRRVLPVMLKAGIGLGELGSLMSGGTAGDVALLKVLDKAAEAVSEMKDTDFEYVVEACLSVTKRLVPEGNNGRGAYQSLGSVRRLQFADDTDMHMMIHMIVEVMKLNLGRFFQQGAAETSTTDDSSTQPPQAQT